MKTLTISLALTGLVLASAPPARAWLSVGAVYCDANNNGIIDSEDTPVSGVLVVVTNTSGTYSNANWTTTDGVITVLLPNNPDSFVNFIHPLTLPAGTTEVLPEFGMFTTTEEQPYGTNYFLIRNPACVTTEPPEPPVTTNRCWLTGGGTIRTGRGQPDFSFGGVVNPGCSPTAAGGGNWNVVWHAGNLHFKGLDIEVVNCGNVPGRPPGSTSPKTGVNYIDFQGVGSLKGIGGKKRDFGTVFFTARAEDLGEPGNLDRLYLRVFNDADETLLLISGNQSDPMEMSPVTIATGNLQMHESSCD